MTEKAVVGLNILSGSPQRFCRITSGEEGPAMRLGCRISKHAHPQTTAVNMKSGHGPQSDHGELGETKQDGRSDGNDKPSDIKVSLDEPTAEADRSRPNMSRLHQLRLTMLA